MSSLPKRKIVPGSGSSMRRSSSALGPKVFSSSPMGRASSSDGRTSSIGSAGFRNSILSCKTPDGKTVTPADLASDILKVSICSGPGEIQTWTGNVTIWKSYITEMFLTLKNGLITGYITVLALHSEKVFSVIDWK